MSDRIMDLNNLVMNNYYRLITNAGYFDKICIFKGFNGGFAIFFDKDGNKEIVHPSFLWCYDNPIIIRTV